VTFRLLLDLLLIEAKLTKVYFGATRNLQSFSDPSDSLGFAFPSAGLTLRNGNEFREHASEQSKPISYAIAQGGT